MEFDGNAEATDAQMLQVPVPNSPDSSTSTSPVRTSVSPTTFAAMRKDPQHAVRFNLTEKRSKKRTTAVLEPQVDWREVNGLTPESPTSWRVITDSETTIPSKYWVLQGEKTLEEVKDVDRCRTKYDERSRLWTKCIFPSPVPNEDSKCVRISPSKFIFSVVLT